MFTKLGSPDGGEKRKVVLVGSNEGPTGLAFCPTTIDASILFSIVLPILVSSETALALWVEITPNFQYQSVEFMGGVFLPPKRLEGTLVKRFGLVSMYLPFGSLGLFMKAKKKKLQLGFGEPIITYA
jgi:hypothetical protein